MQTKFRFDLRKQLKLKKKKKKENDEDWYIWEEFFKYEWLCLNNELEDSKIKKKTNQPLNMVLTYTTHTPAKENPKATEKSKTPKQTTKHEKVQGKQKNTQPGVGNSLIPCCICNHAATKLCEDCDTPWNYFCSEHLETHHKLYFGETHILCDPNTDVLSLFFFFL